MKPSRILLLLACAQVLVSLGIAILCLQQIQATRQMNIQARGINGLANGVAANYRALQILVTDAVEYSARNHDIDPLLFSINAKAAPTNAVPPSPAPGATVPPKKSSKTPPR